MILNHPNCSQGLAPRKRRFHSSTVALLLFIAVFLATGIISEASAQNDLKPVVSPPVTPDTFVLDLRRAPRSKIWKEGDPIRVIPQSFYPDTLIDMPSSPAPNEPKKKDIDNAVVAPSGPSPEVGVAPGISLPASIKSFQGIPATGSVPPDVVGDVGPRANALKSEHFFTI